MPKTANRTSLTDKFLASVKPGEKQTDYPDGHVRGLALRVSPGGAMTWVLIKRLPGAGVRRIRLGHYLRHSDGALSGDSSPRDNFPAGHRALTLKQAREEATRTLALINEGRNPVEERERAKHVRQVDSERGTFADLLRDYIAARKEGSERRAPTTERQAKEWTRIVDGLAERAGAILSMKAREVEPAHIVALLRPIFHEGVDRPASGRGSAGRRNTSGAQGSASKVQSFLRAAFAYGVQSENSVARAAARTYALVHNPVANVPREAKSTPGTRALSRAELRQFWLTIDKAPRVGRIMADLLRFTIASGGQRTHQLAREPWSSYDVEEGTVSLIDRKGRGGQPRVHLVPMTPRMVEIIERVRPLSGGRPWPWSTSEREPIDIASPASAVRYWLKSEHAAVDGKKIAPFTPRDLRRTCTQLMQAAGVPDELADRLQSHGIAGVTGTHYRNNAELYLPEKRRAIELFDAALGRVLDCDLPAT
ncbi:MAG TPA: integrase family protein [Frateuria sp.]|uniref:site-specific integrase n=1 Tax=Frateuria sp. TaxID=2211372 RepID=UPI002DEB3B27|nr:integrase family protein [Frateuria sp.]